MTWCKKLLSTPCIRTIVIILNFTLNFLNSHSGRTLFCLVFSQPVSWSSGNAFVCEAGGLRFKSRADQIGHSVANGSPPLQYFFERRCVAQAQWCGDGPAKSFHALIGVMQRVLMKYLIWLVFSQTILTDLTTNFTKLELSTTIRSQTMTISISSQKGFFRSESFPGLPTTNKISKTYWIFVTLNKCFL